MPKGLDNLKREQILARAFTELDKKHDVVIKGIATVQSLMEQNKREVSRILNLPAGPRGERGPIGPQGIAGKNGKDAKDGVDGKTPVKGVDYNTKADKEELILGVLARIRTPKDGEDAVVDEDKIITSLIEKIKSEELLGVDHVKGLRNEISSYRNQLALKQAGQHGGGDTIVAGTNISLTRNANGTTTISAVGAGTGSVTDFIFTDANGITGVVTTSTTTPTLTLDISGLDAAKIADGSVSNTEFQYLSGVTSDIQTQLNAKMTNPMTTGGDLIYGGASGTPTRLANGTAGQVLTSNGTTLAPTWEDAAGGGNVSNTGTPLDNQIAVWTNATTIEGTTGLTYDGANLQLTGDIGSTGTRITKGWFTDLQVTNAIAGSITGNAATVTTNANLTGVVTSVGNATAIADGALSIAKTSGLQTALDGKQATITFGTGVETALGVNVGTAGSIVVNGGALGTPSSGTVTNLTGTASININGTVGATTPTTGAFTTVNASGLITGESVAVTGTTIPAVGIYQGGAGVLYFATGSASRMRLSSASFRPETNDAIALGESGVGFSDLFLASGAVINFNAGNYTLTHSAGLLTANGAFSIGTSNALTAGTIELGNSSDTTISRIGAGVIAVEGVTVPTVSSTNTVTNKRIQPRTSSSTSDANLTPDLSVANVFYRTTQTVGLTINAPTGTPVIGETIAIYVDSASAQTLTINGTFVVFGAAFPASTTAGKTFMMTAQFNGTNWKTLWANAV